jgi:hypothetical protein
MARIFTDELPENKLRFIGSWRSARVYPKSGFLKRRANLRRRINAALTGVTKAFENLTLAEMHAAYGAVVVEFESLCRDDPLDEAASPRNGGSGLAELDRLAGD